MAGEIRTIFKGGEGYYEEKRSRFLAEVHAVSTQEEALEILEQIRKKHWDARHHCYAYVIGSANPLVRASDDGEPGGTAGRPILSVIEGAGLSDVLIVVTRYFGGTLLGTGGLVRAYTAAARDGLSNSVIAVRKTGVLLYVTSSYTDYGKVEFLLKERGVSILDTAFAENVELTLFAEDGQLESLMKVLKDETGGRLGLTPGERYETDQPISGSINP